MVKDCLRYVKVELNTKYGYPQYFMTDDTSDYLYLLPLLLKGVEPKNFLKWLRSGAETLLGNNTSYIYMDDDKSTLIISTNFDDDEADSFVFRISKNNFRIVINEWMSLYNKKAQEIYFIQVDDQKVVVRSKLHVGELRKETSNNSSGMINKYFWMTLIFTALFLIYKRLIF